MPACLLYVSQPGSILHLISLSPITDARPVQKGQLHHPGGESNGGGGGHNQVGGVRGRGQVLKFALSSYGGGMDQSVTFIPHFFCRMASGCSSRSAANQK